MQPTCFFISFSEYSVGDVFAHIFLIFFPLICYFLLICFFLIVALFLVDPFIDIILFFHFLGIGFFLDT